MTAGVANWQTAIPNYPGLHDAGPRAGGELQAPLTWQQLTQIFEAILDDFIGWIAGAFGGVAVAGWSPFGFLADIGSRVVDLLGRLFGMLGFDNTSAAVSHIDVGQLGAKGSVAGQNNFLIDPMFSSSDAFEPGNGWTWDSTTPSDVGGTGAEAGSACLFVRPGRQSLISNAVAVVPGQTLSASTQTQWSDLGGVGAVSAPPISLSVAYYGSGLLDMVVLDDAGAAAPGQPITADSDWITLSGEHVVPDSIDGIVPNEAALILDVSGEALTGTVWFADAAVKKPDLLPQEAVADLTVDKQAIIGTIAGAAEGTLEDAQARLAGLEADGKIGWDYTPDTRALNDELVNKLAGTAGTDWALTDSATALASTKAATVGHAAAISDLQTVLNDVKAQLAGLSPPAPDAVNWTDTFSRVSTTSLGSGWTQTYSGSGSGILATPDGFSADWIPDNGSYYCRALWNGSQTVSATDYQTVTQAFSSTPRLGGYNDLYGAVAADASGYVLFRLDGLQNWWLYRYLSATLTEIASGTLQWQPSSVMQLVCGDKPLNTVGYLSVYADGQLIWQGIDNVHYSGAGYRGMGFGFGVAGYQLQGGAVTFWSGVDTA